MKLIIGNKNYSSWSLRPWLMLAAFELKFEEQKLSLFTDDFYLQLAKHSPVGKVPVLIDTDSPENTVVWDSLAICEYISERHLGGKGWPDHIDDRAKARALACEMHSSFTAMRGEMPMNCRATKQLTLSAEVEQLVNADIKRIDELWSEQLTQHHDEGPWLFGKFSIVDCMYAPVVLRFLTYGIEVSPLSQQYMQTMLQFPAIKLWLKAALEETEVVGEDEMGINVTT